MESWKTEILDIPEVERPREANVTQSGKIVFKSLTANTIYVWSRGKIISTFEGEMSNNVVKVDLQENIYLADSFRNVISKYDLKGNLLARLTQTPSVIDITIREDGHLLLLTKERELFFCYSDLHSCRKLHTDKYQFVSKIVSVNNGETIGTRSGNFSLHLEKGESLIEFYMLQDIAIDEKGNFYTCSQKGLICKHNKDKEFVHQIAKLDVGNVSSLSVRNGEMIVVSAKNLVRLVLDKRPEIADIFSLMVLSCDGYLVPRKRKAKKNVQRFLKITDKLPIEIQMIIANRCSSSMRDIVLTKDMNFRQLLS